MKTAARSTRHRMPPPGWMLGLEGGTVPEPVEVPIGTDPFQFRAWVRCSGIVPAAGRKVAARCLCRVELIVYAGDLEEGDARGRRARLAEIAAAPLLCHFCQERAAAACYGNAASNEAEKVKPRPALLSAYVRDLVRSGAAPSAENPRGAVWAWQRAQEELRTIALATPADFHALAPELLAELRQLQGWRPYWQDFFRIYHPIPEIHTP